MRIPTVEAATRLGIDPCDLILRVSEMVGGLAECWPEIDDGFVDTLAQLGGGFESARKTPAGTGKTAFVRQESAKSREPRAAGTTAKSSPAASGSPIALARLRILDKMERQNRWGSSGVNLDTLRNHWCRGVEALDEAVAELLDEGILTVTERGNRRRGPFTLNAARKSVIRKLLEEHRR